MKYLDFLGDVDEWTTEQKLLINSILWELCKSMSAKKSPADPGERAIDCLERGLTLAREHYGMQHMWDRFTRDIRGDLDRLVQIHKKKCNAERLDRLRDA